MLTTTIEQCTGRAAQLGEPASNSAEILKTPTAAGVVMPDCAYVCRAVPRFVRDASFCRIGANRGVSDQVAVADAHRNLREVVHPVGLI